MKKIYSLLLLGGLLLLGAQSVWATDYYFRGRSTSWEATKMSQSGTTYSITLSSMNYEEFKLTTSSTDWSGEVGSGSILNTHAGATVPLYDASGNIAFSLDASVAVTIYYDSSTGKVYASAPTHDVTVYANCAYRPKLYVYDYKTNDIHYCGGFPGIEAEEDKVEVEGIELYRFVLDDIIPQGVKLRFIFSNINGHQTAGADGAIQVDGTVGDATLYFILADAEPVTVTYPPYLKGSFNSWEGVTPFINNRATVSLDEVKNYTFKVVSGIDWLGKTSTTLTVDNISAAGLESTSGDEYNITLTPNVIGSYTFVWNSSNNKVTVVYPQISRTTAVGSYGTICVPKDATITGANLYTLTSVGPSSVVITPTNSSDLDAGVPYVYKATSSSQTITLSGDDITLTPSAVNGLTGVFDKGTITTGKYFLANDLIYQAGTGCTIGSHRAYFDIEVPTAAAPSAFRIVEGENGATSIDAIEASEKAVKFIENGQLLIKKNGVVYDMMGAIVK